jgi:hypothetical protein
MAMKPIAPWDIVICPLGNGKGKCMIPRRSGDTALCPHGKPHVEVEQDTYNGCVSCKSVICPTSKNVNSNCSCEVMICK